MHPRRSPRRPRRCAAWSRPPPSSALVDGLNTILLVAAVIAFAAAALSFVLIRERDFVAAEDEGEAPAEMAVAA